MDRRNFFKKTLLGGGAVGLLIGNVLFLKHTYDKRKQPPFPGSELTPDEDICSIAFSLRGNRLASAAANDTLSIWDPTTEDTVSTCPARHGGMMTSISFLGEESWLATISHRNQIVKFWKPGDAKEKTYIAFESTPTCVAFSPATLVGMTPPPSQVAVALDDQSIRILENNESKRMLALMQHPSVVHAPHHFAELETLKGHTDKVNALSFSVDGALLASASDDGTIRIWNISSRQEMTTLQGHAGAITSVAFSKDDRRMASGSADGTIIIWDRETMAQVGVLQGHTDAVLNTVFYQDSNWLVSSSADQTTRLWSLENGFQEGLRLSENPGKYSVIDLSADEQYFASSWGKEVKFWKTSELLSQAKQNLGVT